MAAVSGGENLAGPEFLFYRDPKHVVIYHVKGGYDALLADKRC